MPFIGTTPTQGFVSSFPKQSFTPNGSTTVFTLTNPVASANDLEVFVGNVRQEPTTAYTAAGTTLTMSEAPATGLNFYVINKSFAQVTTTPPVNSISTDKILDNAVSNAKIATGITASKLTGALPAISGASLTGLTEPGAVQVAEASGGGSATQAFNGCFTSTYKFYLVLASISLDATERCNIRLQDSSNNERTSAVYYNATMRNSQSNGSNAHNQAGQWGATSFSPERDILANNPHASYRIWVFGPTDTNMKTHMQMDFYSQASGVMNQTKGSCVYDSATNDAGIRFITTGSANIKTTSQFKIYGFK